MEPSTEVKPLFTVIGWAKFVLSMSINCLPRTPSTSACLRYPRAMPVVSGLALGGATTQLRRIGRMYHGTACLPPLG
jgi:hypothetical protein